MVNEKKIRLMTEAEMLKKQNKRELFNSGKFFKNDFVVFSVVKAIISAAIAYFLIVMLIFLTQADTLLTTISISQLGNLLLGFIWIFFILLAATIAISLIINFRRYKESTKIMKRYKNVLRKLDELNEQ